MSNSVENQITKNTDYIGFTFNGKHSSELGIVRVSNGSRFDQDLLPPIQDKTVQVPGGDGEYYFGSYFGKRVFNINYAFDSLTEKQLADIKKTFGDKKIHDLVFDELPYKIYSAKVTGTAQIKYIPFAEGTDNRIYKGEGSVQFTAFYPFARCEKKFLDEYQETNLNEWKTASGLEASNPRSTKEDNNKHRKNIDAIRHHNAEEGSYSAGYHINFRNPGDLEVDFSFRLFFNGNDSPKIPAGKIYHQGSERYLEFSEIFPQGEDTSIVFNGKTKLIEGYNKDNSKTGNLYNFSIIKGDFFKIPKGKGWIIISDGIVDNFGMEENKVIENGEEIFIDLHTYPAIQYNYLYF